MPGPASESIGRYMKMSLGRKFTSTSPARVRKIRVFPTSHQSRIDRAQGHSQQWSLWKPVSQEGAGGEHKEGLARVSQVASPELPWCPVDERQHLFRGQASPTPGCRASGPASQSPPTSTLQG